jgi:hypothetical protein
MLIRDAGKREGRGGGIADYHPRFIHLLEMAYLDPEDVRSKIREHESWILDGPLN